ncbi:MAG: hypothetical protein DMF95_24565 [Acidobacteria bacterium]|nr:MAG: hypothetical protein DMF95_24565 [Acidobacteriota bacterium]
MLLATAPISRAIELRRAFDALRRASEAALREPQPACEHLECPEPVRARAISGSWLLAPGFWLLASGFWLLLASGFWLLASGFWLLASGFRLPTSDFHFWYGPPECPSSRPRSSNVCRAVFSARSAILTPNCIGSSWRSCIDTSSSASRLSW